MHEILSYAIQMGGNHLPYLELVTDNRYDGAIGDVVKEQIFEKKFYVSLEDGVYEGVTTIKLTGCKLFKHSHSSIEKVTRYRYIFLFEDSTTNTKVELIEKRDGTTISENEKKLLKEQADKHKNG